MPPIQIDNLQATGDSIDRTDPAMDASLEHHVPTMLQKGWE